jgi:hypothetical protein
MYQSALVPEKGYATMSVDGKRRDVHRALWIEMHGPIPSGMHVLHHCDRRACVNPDHHYLGTHAQNMVDMSTRRRAVAGERHHLAKLTWERVKEIRASSASSRSLAKLLGVAAGTVQRVRSNKTWARQ